jgi:hypothetical protein
MRVVKQGADIILTIEEDGGAYNRHITEGAQQMSA